MVCCTKALAVHTVKRSHSVDTCCTRIRCRCRCFCCCCRLASLSNASVPFEISCESSSFSSSEAVVVTVGLSRSKLARTREVRQLLLLVPRSAASKGRFQQQLCQRCRPRASQLQRRHRRRVNGVRLSLTPVPTSHACMAPLTISVPSPIQPSLRSLFLNGFGSLIAYIAALDPRHSQFRQN
jgi:hypothetical protein